MHNSSLLDVEERVMLLDAGEFGPILFFLFLQVLSFEDFANAFFFSCAAFLRGLHSPSSLTLNDLPISLEDSLRKFKFASVEGQRLSKRSQDISTDLPISSEDSSLGLVGGQSVSNKQREIFTKSGRVPGDEGAEQSNDKSWTTSSVGLDAASALTFAWSEIKIPWTLRCLPKDPGDPSLYRMMPGSFLAVSSSIISGSWSSLPFQQWRQTLK